jgi:carboxyl-terminal processing protease
MKYLLAIAFWLYSLNVVGQLDTTSNLPDAEKLYGLSLFWKEASYNFAYFDKAKINWDSAYQAFIPQVLKTENTYQYYRVLQKFCALLKDGHTNINMPRYIQKGDINVDIGFQFIDGKVYSTSIPKKDSSLVPPGSELISVNGTPTIDFLQNEIFPYISYSATHQLYSTAINQIIRPPYAFNNKPVHLTFKTPAGAVISYDARPNTGNTEWATIPNILKPGFITILPGNIAYVQLRHFRDTTIVSEFKKHLPELYKANGVILDIRYNGGGNSDIGVEILKYFTEQKQIKGSAWKTPNNIAAYRAWGKIYKLEDTINMNEKDKQVIKRSIQVANRDYWFEERADTYQNNLTIPRIKAPLVVLIGNNTGSAAEDFLISLDDIKGRAVTVGEPTYGSTGQPLSFALPGEGSARICTKKDTYPDGREFVGYGIKPGIEVKMTITDLVKGKDAVLERAIELLKSK